MRRFTGLRCSFPCKLRAVKRGRSFQGTSSDYSGLAFISLGSIILLFFGWIIGAVLVAKSTSWSRRDKWIALCLPPGGYAFLIPWYVFLGTTSLTSRFCTLTCPPITATQFALIATTYALFVLPLLSTSYLAYKLWKPNQEPRELASSESS
jgi:hypothetical protein